MKPRIVFVQLSLALGLVALFASSVDAQNAKAPAKPAVAPKAGDPPGTATIQASLRAWFKKYANEDGEWGKEEAARAFGYRHPYDWVPPAKEPKEGDDSKKDEKKDKDAKKDDTTESEGLKGAKSMTSSTPDKRYSRRMDYLFLKALDVDDDEKISKEEFETWAHDYAVQVARVMDNQQKATEAQLRQLALQQRQLEQSLRNAMARNQARRPPPRRR